MGEKELDKAFDGSDIPELGSIDKYSPVDNKVYFYNQANKRVAILCNHQKSVSKSHDEQMQKLEDRLEDLKTLLKQQEKELLWAKGKRKVPKSAKWRPKPAKQIESQIEKTKTRINKVGLNLKLIIRKWLSVRQRSTIWTPE